MPHLDRLIDELYALPIETFVAERNARAKGSSDSAAIRALTKPSAAAWAINLLAREGDALGPLLELGDRMRAAAPAELRSLDRERRDRITAAVGASADLAEKHGHPLSESVRRDLQATFQAAIADADAAAAVASGRLLRALEPAGFGSVDVEGAVAGEVTRPRPSANTPVLEPEVDTRALEAAQREAEEAAHELETAVALRDGARAELDAAEARVEEAEQELERSRAEARRLDEEYAKAERAARESERRARSAQRELDRLG